jgi:hypothetical protein
MNRVYRPGPSRPSMAERAFHLVAGGAVFAWFMLSLGAFLAVWGG